MSNMAWRSGAHISVFVRLLLVAVALCCAGGRGQAQLATSFYNVTGIQTKVLPNAVQITIRTDGTVAFGGDRAEFVDFDQWDAKPTTAFRIRLLHARSMLPAFVDLGAYPVDSAVVSLGTDELVSPYFRNGDYGQPKPRVDIQFRFFVPVQVKRFIVDKQSYDSYGDNYERGTVFADTLTPRDVEVKLGDDRRSIVITVISDHADAGRAMNLKRSPAQLHNHHQLVHSTGPGVYQVDALHTPLSELLSEFSSEAKIPLTARADAQKVDVSLHLPAATPDQLLSALRVGYGLVVSARSDMEGGGYTVGRNGPMSVTERVQLNHLKPESARLLFPDFLLTTMHADSATNSLFVTASPDVLARVKRDIARFDLPRPQVRIDAHLWEFTSEQDAHHVIELAGAIPYESATYKPDLGQLTVAINSAQRAVFTTSLQALNATGKARLVASPYITVASGQAGTLFLGRQRFITVLREQWWGQDLQTMKLNVGYSLVVAPTICAGDDITLDINPKISTVDSVEPGTGLPTLGIRETNTAQRIRSGESVVIAGLDIDTNSRDQRGVARLPGEAGAKRRNRNRGYTVLLVTAHKE